MSIDTSIRKRILALAGGAAVLGASQGCVVEDAEDFADEFYETDGEFDELRSGAGDGAGAASSSGSGSGSGSGSAACGGSGQLCCETTPGEPYCGTADNKTPCPAGQVC